jgi:hypothetical protein
MTIQLTTIIATDVGGLIFMIVWIGILLLIAYNIFKSCLRRNPDPSRPPPRPSRPSGSGWFPGGYRDDYTNTAPPPYSKTTPDTSQGSGWRPGFWTGAALGGLGAALFNNRGQTSQTAQRPVSYDWERVYPRRTATTSDDRGEGSSTLGAMRRSIGLGGSNVR